MFTTKTKTGNRTAPFGRNAPCGFQAGDANLRRYVSNDPTDETDPSGLIEIYFDGTMQDEKSRSNIYRMYEASKAPVYDPNDPQPGTKIYFKSPLLSPNRQDWNDRLNTLVKEVLTLWIKQAQKGKREPIYLFGWSRGGVGALALVEKIDRLFRDTFNPLSDEEKELYDQMQRLLVKTNFKYDFVGLIDPVATMVVEEENKLNPVKWFDTPNLELPTYADQVWLGMRDRTVDGPKDKILFRQATVTQLSIPGVLERTPEKKSYTLTHGGTGMDEGVLKDLVAAAEKAGVKFDEEMLFKK
jgi:hypothetical protein